MGLTCISGRARGSGGFRMGKGNPQGSRQDRQEEQPGSGRVTRSRPWGLQSGMLYQQDRYSWQTASPAQTRSGHLTATALPRSLVVGLCPLCESPDAAAVSVWGLAGGERRLPSADCRLSTK